MRHIAMEVDLEALEEVQDIEAIIEMMGLNKDNEVVDAIIKGVKDFQSHTHLKRYLKEVNANVIYLNLQID